MKDLLNLLNREKSEDFDAIRIGLASPEMIRSWPPSSALSPSSAPSPSASLSLFTYYLLYYTVAEADF